MGKFSLSPMRSVLLLGLFLELFVWPSPARSAGDCQGDICVGDVVYDTDSGPLKATVIGFDGDNILLQDSQGRQSKEMKSYLALTKFPCEFDGFCLGDEVIDYDSGFIQVEIIARKADTRGRDSSFLYQTKNGKIASEIITYLGNTRPTACDTKGFCVGDEVFDRDSNPGQGRIIALPLQGSDKAYVIRYSNGSVGTESAGYLNVIRKSQDVKDAEELEFYVKEEIADRELYAKYRAEKMNHAQALNAASGPGWFSYSDTAKFLRTTAAYVYQADQKFLMSLAAMATDLDRKDSETQKVLLGFILPWLKNSGYSGLQKRYLEKAASKITAQLIADGLLPLSQVESSIAKRKLALAFLANSLLNMQGQFPEADRVRAQSITTELGKILNSNLRYRDLQGLYPILQELEALYMRQTQNLYLLGRIAADMVVVEFLRNS